MKTVNLGHRILISKEDNDRINSANLCGIITTDGNFFYCKFTEHKNLVKNLKKYDINMKNALRFSAFNGGVVKLESPPGLFSSVDQKQEDQIFISPRQVIAIYNILLLLDLGFEESIADHRFLNVGFNESKNTNLRKTNLSTIKNTLGSNFSMSYLKDCMISKQK